MQVRGVSGVGKVKGDVGPRQADATRDRLWEARRIESSWEVVDVPSASPGSFLLVEAIFEQSRAAFGFLGERGLRAEVLGDRAARTLLQFLDGDAAVDPHLADQLAVPLAVGRWRRPRDARTGSPRTWSRWRRSCRGSGSRRGPGAGSAVRAGLEVAAH